MKANTREKIMTRTAMVVSAAVAVCAIAACGGAAGQAGSGGNGTYSLIGAAYPACEAQGQSLAAYLATGNPAADNLSWGNERQQELSLTGAQQSLYISQTADAYISQCDSADAQAAQASASASAQAGQWAAAHQECTKIGGNMGAAACMNVPYYDGDGHGTYQYDLTVSGSGFKPNTATGYANFSATRTQCQGLGYWGFGLCLVNNPH